MRPQLASGTLLTMGLVDDVVFQARGAHGCSNSDYDFVLTSCCERVGVIDNELDDFYWDAETPSRSVDLSQLPDCPLCGAATWSLGPIDDMNHVPEHWRWACDGQARAGRRIVRPLAAHVAELLNVCRQISTPLPGFNDALFLDTTDPRVRHQVGWKVAAGGLQTSAQFAPLFDRLVVSGYAWLNLSAYGIFRGDLVIGLELPRDVIGVAAGLTSVTYSASPLAREGAVSWQLELDLED